MQQADRAPVEVEVDVRVLAVDHVDLGERRPRPLLDGVLDELLGRVGVGVRLLPRRGEGAELALHPADVRLVQIQVLHEVDLVRTPAHTPRTVGELADLQEVVGLENRETVLEVEPSAALDLLPDSLQRAQLDDGHVSAPDR